jgi:hypothetical protein
MAEAHHRQAWAHTSSLMALIANCHRDPKRGRALRPEDFFDPARLDTDPDSLPAADMAMVKDALMGKCSGHPQPAASNKENTST